MKNEREQKLEFIPLFDALSESLSPFHDSIVSTFDGTIGDNGIEIILSANRGEVIRANLYNLQNGKVKSYEPLARGRWCSPTADLEENSYEYQKLNRVTDEVKQQYEQWKTNERHNPMREWSKARANRAVWGMDLVIMPWEWYGKAKTPKREEDQEIEDIQNRLEELASKPGAAFETIKSPKKKPASVLSQKPQKDDIGKKLLEDAEFRSNYLRNNPPDRGAKRRNPER